MKRVPIRFSISPTSVSCWVARISVAFSARPSRLSRSISRRPSREASRNQASSNSTTLCTRAVAGHEPHRVGGDQLQRRDAEPLGLVVVGARDPRRGQREAAGLDRRHRPLRRDAGAFAVAEPEPGDAGVGPHAQRLAGRARVRVVGAEQQRRARAGSSAPAPSSARRTALRTCVSHAGGACGSSSIRYELARSSRSALGRDDERVEQPAVAVVAGELDHVHAAVELGQALEVVVGLGVDVDDQRAAALGLEREQLGRDRLARSRACPRAGSTAAAPSARPR